ncbi:MAG: hypothetical protein J0I17_10925 ['Candidatus Kapabacteria' thiocyanatum]|uniref:TonB-dependent receptor-like beta-barrel domain-containing protein n=1 Tax=Candidatus Kapaibacterium thiocyanatum TaxID=1895771 RepID=A0A1M3L3R3_9BACT|nr:hypothetical protein ['Candidatus Kapabacteria' thiocyanatum]OJX59996.1 MAG: hypothetical protein BGO89_08380 ['Candidatus Kapabacteria' thiocyanatum]
MTIPTPLAIGVLCTLIAPFAIVSASAQFDDLGKITGSVQLDAQTYSKDTLIGAPEVPEKILSNAFVNLLYTRGKFTAGLRFESYQNPLLGIDPRYASTGAGTGIGIPYRFFTYSDTHFEITGGNFYEQFGSGMILRTYEERNLGFDNSIDGVRARFMPIDGIKLTGFIGRQRSFFDLSEGIMRGADLSLDINSIDENLLPRDMQVQLGGSMVSRFQPDLDDFLKLPENVMAWSTRARLGYQDVNLDMEYAHKINDPSAANGQSFNTGNAIYANLSYARQGLGVNLAAKRIDNMDFRSDRTATGNVQTVNYLPALTKQHTWRLITLYPYATQPTGEFAVQADVTFTIPKGSFLGDDETTVSLNYSEVRALDTTWTTDLRYDAKFMWSDRKYYQDANIEIQRKWGRKFKTTFSFIHLKYDQDIIERRAAPTEKKYGLITADFAVLELWWQTARGQSLRTEFQYMKVTHEAGAQLALQNGDWAMALFEYTVSPSWFFTVFDEYNFGNNDEALRVHYPNATVAYVKDALRLQAGYGRVRGGILCVGGICRPVPASNGFTLGLTYTF